MINSALINSLLTRIGRLEYRMRAFEATDTHGRVCCRVYRNSIQTLANATPTGLSWNTEITDISGMFDIANPTRLTASIDGFYISGCTWSISGASIASTGARISTNLQLNGSNLIAGPVGVTTSGIDWRGEGTGGIWLRAGDYVEWIVYQNLGASKSIVAADATNQYFNCGWLVKVA